MKQFCTVSVIVGIFLLSVSCVNSGKQQKIQPLRFVLPDLPLTVSTDSEASAYMARHYWTHFPFEDSTCIHQEEFARPLFTRFAQILGQVPLDEARKGVTNLMQLAGSSGKDTATQKTVFRFFFDLCSHYFHDPNSPYVNEELFIPALKAYLESPLPDDGEKIQPAFLLELAMKNRVGEKALDFGFVSAARNFPYTDDPSRIQTIYSLEAPFLLLFFSNPGCPNCRDVMQQLLGSALLSEMIQRKDLVILTIYPDQDLESWQEYLPQLPEQWINAYNPGAEVKNNHLYDLKAIPTLYLLDKNKTVLVKDGTSSTHIEAALKQQAYFL